MAKTSLSFALVSLLLGGAASLQGCGDNFTTTPFGEPTVAGAGGSGSGASTSAVGGSAPTSGNGGSASATAGSQTATSSAATTSTVAASSGGGLVDHAIPCGKNLSCPTTCCIGAAEAYCGESNEACSAKGLLGLSCNDTSDCAPDNICCFSHGGENVLPSARCANSCGDAHEQLCGSAADCPSSKKNCETLKLNAKDTPWKYCKP